MTLWKRLDQAEARVLADPQGFRGGVRLTQRKLGFFVHYGQDCRQDAGWVYLDQVSGEITSCEYE